jgi:hypothetical protein
LSLADALPGSDSVVSSRFSLVSYVPTLIAVGYVGLLLAAGAPTGKFDLQLALDRVNNLSAVDVALLLLGVVVSAALLHPLQLPLVRLLEGYWPVRLRGLRVVAVDRQRRLRAELARRTQLDEQGVQVISSEVQQEILEASYLLARRFPSIPLVLPTALGNVLRAMEETAGSNYGADAVAWWPRLYVVLGDRCKTIVDDRRNQLDLACRMSVVGMILSLVSIVLLIPSGWWILLAAAPSVVSVLSYRVAVTVAAGYGESVHVAFDVHRFDLLRQLHIELPVTRAAEISLNRKLTRFWLQGVPLHGIRFDHPSK